jgi:hypothetical protein
MLLLQEYSSITATTIIFDEEIRNSKMATNCLSTESFVVKGTRKNKGNSVRPYEETTIVNQPVQRKRGGDDDNYLTLVTDTKLYTVFLLTSHRLTLFTSIHIEDLDTQTSL